MQNHSGMIDNGLDQLKIPTPWSGDKDADIESTSYSPGLNSNVPGSVDDVFQEYLQSN